LKYELNVRLNKNRSRLNRTKVELKCKRRGRNITFGRGLNRTKVELKLIFWRWFTIVIPCLNRTKVELKFWKVVDYVFGEMVLIVLK